MNADAKSRAARRRRVALFTRFDLELAAVRVLGTLAFPRLAYWLRWPNRLGPRGLLVYIALTAIFRVWLISGLKRAFEDGQRLREQLGREPTHQELADALASKTAKPAAARSGSPPC